MNLLPSDTMYCHLKNRGLILSDITRVEIPEPAQTQQSFLSKLGSYLTKKQTPIINGDLKVKPIANSAFIVANKNVLIFYKYKIEEETNILVVDVPQIIQLKSDVLDVVPCPGKYVIDRT